MRPAVLSVVTASRVESFEEEMFWNISWHRDGAGASGPAYSLKALGADSGRRKTSSSGNSCLAYPR